MTDYQGSLEFQAVIGKFIEKMGFEIESVKVLEDGSIDFKARTASPMGGKVTSLIRASVYSRQVNANDIEDLNGTMGETGAVRAAYITTSGFSDDAVEIAKDKPISLINKYQLMDSIEKRGLITDRSLMESLDRFGMGEQHFQGIEQSFASSKTDPQAREYFETLAKKGSEKVANLEVRYCPLTVLKVISQKDVWTEDQTIRSVEKKDYLFVNLNNLDLYYMIQKRKKNATERLLLRSDIIKKIFGLPEESKQYLLNLLDYGDLPIEDLQGMDLSILKNRKVIDTYEGNRMKKGDFTEYVQMFLEGLVETINMIVDEILYGLSSWGEGTEKKTEEVKPKKKVMAVVNMPHVFGGIYDIWKYLETTRGLRTDASIDALNYSSNDVSKILKSVMKGKVRPEGVLFMPYFRAKYLDKEGKVSKYEMLVTPKFRDEAAKDAAEKTPPKPPRKMPPAGEFKLIK
ncbi:MAG: restriction endonuclease [Candidatus Altiarchaeota archaeon]